MTATSMYEDYIRAFNAGDSRAYSRYYADDVVLVNGGGNTLRGARAIIEFYEELKCRMRREIEVQGIVEGHGCLAAALRSRFEIIAEDTSFAGQILGPGDQVDLRSVALYEHEEGRFNRIQATTIERRLLRFAGQS